MPKLRVTSRYVNLGLNAAFDVGAVVECTEEERRFYLADSPGSFEDAEQEAAPEHKEVPEPPQDKAVKRAPRSKSIRSRSEPNEEA